VTIAACNATDSGAANGRGSILLAEIPVRDSARATDFYAGLFGWSFEHGEADGWLFTTGTGELMGRITIDRPAGRDGVQVTVAVDDVAASTRRVIELGGGNAESGRWGGSDVGKWTVLIDPNGNRLSIFHGRIGGRRHGDRHPGVLDAESQ
jgi:uncharacterized protein